MDIDVEQSQAWLEILRVTQRSLVNLKATEDKAKLTRASGSASLVIGVRQIKDFALRLAGELARLGVIGPGGHLTKVARRAGVVDPRESEGMPGVNSERVMIVVDLGTSEPIDNGEASTGPRFVSSTQILGMESSSDSG